MMKFFVMLQRGFLAVALSLFPLFSYAAQPTVTHIQSMPFDGYTRIIFNINELSQYHVFRLSNPERVVVDFEHARLKANLKSLHLDSSSITNVRSGTPKPATLRIVFDMAQTSHYKTSIVTNGRESELVVDITSAAMKKTINKVAKVVTKTYEAHESRQAHESHETHEVHQAVVAKKTEQPLPSKKPALEVSTVTKATPVIIVIDAGHGGKDPGTIGVNGTKEKDVVLAIAIRLAELINREPNLHAVLTRSSDHFVKLRDRLRLARKDNANLFVAIHADAYLTAESSGASVYALSRHGATSEAARWLAKRDNYSELGGVDFDGLVDKSYMLRSVLIDLAQTATITDSVKLGADVLHALSNVTRLHYPRVEQAPFMVLKSPDIPSILVETGYLSNPKEEERLRDPEYRDRIAQALLTGVHRYLARNKLI